MLIDPARITVSCFDGDIIAGSHSKGLNFDTIVRNTQVTTSWNNGSVENFLLKQRFYYQSGYCTIQWDLWGIYWWPPNWARYHRGFIQNKSFPYAVKKNVFPVPPVASTRNILGHHGIDLFSAIREVFPNYFKTSSKILLCSSLSKE